MNTTSAGSSTTQREESSRRVSRQMEQSSCSVRLKHRAQNPIVSLTSISAFAKGRASSGVNRKRWKVSLCAVLGPMPGSLANSSTVSYTHLRAHETKANLVCRLLLEKKKKKKQRTKLIAYIKQKKKKKNRNTSRK